MHAIDTNVMVRYVTNDDPVQSPTARRFVDTHQVRVTWTVMLEAEWVLRSAYKLPRERILRVMRQFAGLPTVSIDDAERFAMALEWFAQGMDFADAMHMAGCDDDETLATFDRRLVTAARKAMAGKVKAL